MTINRRPAFSGKLIRSEVVRLTAASTSRDASVTTNIIQLFVAGSDGARIENVIIQALGNTTAGSIRVYRVNAGTYRLIVEIAVPARTIDLSNGVLPFRDDQTIRTQIGDVLPAIQLKANEAVYVATQNAESFDVHAWGGDF